jgi:RNA polymerase sigma factor for flagellar operon FliA
LPPPDPSTPTPPRTPPHPDRPEVLARFRAQMDLVDLNARQMARRMGTSSVTLDDLRSFAQEGLLVAARTFDETHGVPFRRWANLRVRGAIIDGVRKWGSLPRRVYRELRSIAAADTLQDAYDAEDAAHPARTAEAADARLTSYLAGLATAMAMGAIASTASIHSDGAEALAHDPSPEEAVATAELMARVKAIMARLPDSERTLVERHYFGEQTLDEAAAALGLSKSWGSRLHARAIDFIARELRREPT